MHVTVPKEKKKKSKDQWADKVRAKQLAATQQEKKCLPDRQADKGSEGKVSPSWMTFTENIHFFRTTKKSQISS